MRLYFKPDANTRTNKHGVTMRQFSEYRWVPECCSTCHHLDVETGDYGEILSGPYCLKNLFLPVRKGTCQRKAA